MLPARLSPSVVPLEGAVVAGFPCEEASSKVRVSKGLLAADAPSPWCGGGEAVLGPSADDPVRRSTESKCSKTLRISWAA
jgi:hypothetical protein